jgi:hypothetical protein
MQCRSYQGGIKIQSPPKLLMRLLVVGLWGIISCTKVDKYPSHLRPKNFISAISYSIARAIASNGARASCVWKSSRWNC